MLLAAGSMGGGHVAVRLPRAPGRIHQPCCGGSPWKGQSGILGFIGFTAFRPVFGAPECSCFSRDSQVRFKMGR